LPPSVYGYRTMSTGARNPVRHGRTLGPAVAARVALLNNDPLLPTAEENRLRNHLRVIEYQDASAGRAARIGGHKEALQSTGWRASLYSDPVRGSARCLSERSLRRETGRRRSAEPSGPAGHPSTGRDRHN
jgi:hypothetical protein